MFRIVFVLSVALAVNGQQWISPCPGLFQYDKGGVQGGDTWYGDITLKTDQELSGIWLRIVLDRPPIEVDTDFGEVVQREAQDYLIRKPTQKLKVGDTQRIRITVKFNSLEPAPQLVGFRLNARVVCPENGILDKTQPITAPPETKPANEIPSPCPDVFNYEPLNNTGKWFGNVILKSETQLDGVWIRISLDRETVQLGNWFGEVTTGDNKEYVIKNPSFTLSPGNTHTVRFFIKFKPGTPLPKVVEIKQNGKVVCQADVLVVPVNSNSPILPNGGISPSVQRPVRPPPSPPQSSDDGFYSPDFLQDENEVECGTTVAQPRPLITYGQATEEGEWPWHAALYRTKGADTKYICGGSLISKLHVITVAHCVARVYTSDPVDTDSIVVFLGKYFLTKFNAGIQYFQAARIIIHRDYNYRTFRNDIAIIKLNQPVRFTDRVRPICLWSERRELDYIIGKEGTVVGWGFDQTGVVTETLFKTNMPIVNTQTCIYSYPEFFSRFTNEKTYCAGFRNYSSVCNGDSGGGMVFPKLDQPKKWQLRGLVSIGVALQSQAVCDTKHYAVFTDVAKYLPWIASVLLQ